MLHSLHVEKFRGFGTLALEGLGRVNLIVGKNSTGKTSLLEAVTLVSNPPQIDALPGLFRANEGLTQTRFYPWLLKDGFGEVGARLSATSNHGDQSLVFVRDPVDSGFGDRPDGMAGGYVWHREGHSLWQSNSGLKMRVHAVSVQHREPASLVDAFADAVRSPADERRMEELLRVVDPRVRSVRVDSAGEKPFIVVDVGLEQRLPLPQAGQGMYRVVAILSDIIGRKPALCLIDELENGVHYSALLGLWKGLAELAASIDLQMFVTTHSWECLLAAHEAFAARETYDLRIIQLYSLADGTSGRVLDRGGIEAAIAGQIELR